MMDKIFRRASGVTIYLGDGTAGSDILFEELAEADKLLSRRQSCNRQSPSKTIIRELDLLFLRSWFKRVWTLQEVYVNDSITFMCGSAYASAAALQECSSGYQHTRVT